MKKITPEWGFYLTVVWKIDTDMKNVCNNASYFQRAIILATCAFKSIAEQRDQHHVLQRK